MTKKELEIRCEVMEERLNKINETETIGAIMANCDPDFLEKCISWKIVILTNRMEEEMTAIEMQRFLNQQYTEGKTELEAYRNLMAILGLSYPQKSEKEK